MPLDAAKGLLDEAAKRARRAADDLIGPLYERIDDKMTPTEREEARKDPVFRKNDDEFQKSREERKRRKAEGE